MKIEGQNKEMPFIEDLVTSSFSTKIKIEMERIFCFHQTINWIYYSIS